MPVFCEEIWDDERELNEFVEVRKPWIDIEREERRKLKIIIKRPALYDDHREQYDEIWPDDVEEIWDGERELNQDEIPFTVGRTTKDKISYVRKYRLVLNNTRHRDFNKLKIDRVEMIILDNERELRIGIDIEKYLNSHD